MAASAPNSGNKYHRDITIQILKRVTLLYVFSSFPNVQIADLATWLAIRINSPKTIGTLANCSE